VKRKKGEENVLGGRITRETTFFSTARGDYQKITAALSKEN